MKIHLTSVLVDDQAKAPTDMGPVTTAVLDDTCGSLIQIAAPASST